MDKSLVAAMVDGNCPRCRKGDIFAYTILERPGKFNKMNERCPNCDVRLEPEPGFYQGAMYVSYAITVMVIGIVGLVLYLAGDPSEWVYVGTAIGIMVLLIPVNYRWSRIIYLYSFGGLKYKPHQSD